MTKNMIFVCPVTKKNVQYRVDATQVPDHHYESVTCLACDGVHFIDLKTGKAVKHHEK